MLNIDASQATATSARSFERPAVHTDLFINNRDVTGQGAPISMINPATEAFVVRFSGASLAQVDEAVRSASVAFDKGDWSDPHFRKEKLHKLADLIEANSALLMSLLVREIGTPVALTANHVDVPVTFLRWFADAAAKDRGRDLGVNRSKTATSTITYRPAGVVAAITAYNYPLLISITKIGAALAAGCTTVLLSSPQAPLAVLMLGRLVREAGFPPGVINILAGDADVGRALSEHPAINKVSFTGSVNVGRKVMQQASAGLRGVVLELGGKSAAIMLPGVDFSKYVDALHARYARHAGQGCGSPTRILVERSRMDEFIALSRTAYEKIKVGDPSDPQNIVGPLISKAHRDRVEGVVKEALAAGAIVAAGGGRPAIDRGWFINPALVTGIDNTSRLAREEIFGPVAVLLSYESVDEAIAIANDSDLGLKAYLYGDPGMCQALAPRLRVGTVVINGGGGLRPDATMCGYKHSGIGNEWGEEGILEFLETQHIDCALA